jgi:hypothetical protein
LVEAWRDIEDHAKDLAKRLMGKEAATPSRTWNLLSSARPEMVLFLAVTARQQAVAQKIKNFFTKWRDVQKRIPLPEMTELLITPQVAGISQDCARRIHAPARWKAAFAHRDPEIPEAVSPPPPPPPPPPRRGRGPKAAAVAAPAPPAETPTKPVKGRGKKAGSAPAAQVPAPVIQSRPPEPKAKTEQKALISSKKLIKTKAAEKHSKPARKPAPKKAVRKTAAKKAKPKKSKKR